MPLMVQLSSGEGNLSLPAAMPELLITPDRTQIFMLVLPAFVWVEA